MSSDSGAGRKPIVQLKVSDRISSYTYSRKLNQQSVAVQSQRRMKVRERRKEKKINRIKTAEEKYHPMRLKSSGVMEDGLERFSR